MYDHEEIGCAGSVTQQTEDEWVKNLRLEYIASAGGARAGWVRKYLKYRGVMCPYDISGSNDSTFISRESS